MSVRDLTAFGKKKGEIARRREGVRDGEREEEKRDERN